MDNFDFTNSIIYPAVNLCKPKRLKILKFFRIIFLFGTIVFLIFFLASYFVLNKHSQTISGFCLIFFSIFFLITSVEMFLRLKVKNPKTHKNSYNLADYLDFESALAIKETKNVIYRFRLSYADATSLFYSLIKTNSYAGFVLNRLLIDKADLSKRIENSFKIPNRSGEETVLLETIIKFAKQLAESKGNVNITIGDLIMSLAKHESFFKKELIIRGLQAEDVEGLINWQDRVANKQKENAKFWEYKNMVRKGSLGKQWAAGYTITLDQYSIDWTEKIKKEGYPDVIGYVNETELAERILSNAEINNALIISEPGVGAKNIIYAISKRSVLEEGLPPMHNKRVVELLLPTLLASMQSIDQVETVLEKIFQEATAAGNIILVIDEFHNFVETDQRPGAINIAGILSPYLPLPHFHLVGLASYAGLHRKIELNPSLLSLFGRVEVKEPTKEETLSMLQYYLPELEARYRKYVSYPALKQIVELCDRYITSMPFPKKAREVLEEVLVDATSSKNFWVLPKDVDRVVAQKTEIPVGRIETQEKSILLNLEKLIHQRIINQEEAVKEVSSALRRARSEITVRNKPMGTFLFLGPTGVGKTETSKAIAAIYFGSEDKMIRLDMSEFQNLEDIPRLIGSPGQEGLLITKVKENPFSLILLDELEKAHLNILNLFLQVLDEGYITDGLGRKIDFRNTIIIATSNAGYKLILEALKEHRPVTEIKDKLLDYLFQEGIFRPEFINRFDAAVVFKSLSPQNLLDITQLHLQKIKDSLGDKNIELLITQELKEKIVSLGYDPTFGARNLKRVIQDRVENALAEALLRDEIKRGDIVNIDPNDFSVDVINTRL
ncbi:MAG: AAA family ATPase [Candidatus Pacebacteria bacterium]|nr:AAA family ATPase [Candidatus Paceibacterota bacterium]